MVYRFKITLKEITPPIWRRIEVPDTYTFYDLHVAIQDAMGWQDYHLYEFEMKDPQDEALTWIGIPHEEYGRPIMPSWETHILKFFSDTNSVANYTYDFGDNWQHKIELEDIVPVEESIKYPRCIEGKRACPLEDSGGVPGYLDLIRVLDDPFDPEYEEMLRQVGAMYNPDYFQPNKVVFRNPAESLKHFHEEDTF